MPLTIQWCMVGVVFGFILCGMLVAYADRFHRGEP